MKKLIAVFIAVGLLMGIFLNPVQAETVPLNFYAPSPLPASVATALDLASIYLQPVHDLKDADLILLADAWPDDPRLVEQVRSGTPVLIFPGILTTTAALTPFLGEDVRTEKVETALSLAPVKTSTHELAQDIIWTSSPQVRARLQIEAASLSAIVNGYETGEVILGQARLGAGDVYLFTPFLTDANPQIQEWAYFNYFIYALAVRASGEIPLTFHAYPASPVPHQHEQTFLILFLLGAIAISILIFFFVRRYSRRHPELLDTLVTNRKEYDAREAGTDWEEVGFHRPLGGFLLAFMLGLVLFIPLIIYQNLVLPTYILPSAQALGIWGRVVQFFQMLWLFFDFGTSTAFIKYFSQYRVHDPKRAIQYGQIFVWWQCISGTIQVALISSLAATVVPQTLYAIYAWSIIIHAIIQIPGFYQVMRHALTALQRFDYAQIIDLAFNLVFPIIAQLAVVPLLVLWGKSHPIFGMSMGGLFGLGLAAYLTEILTFILGIVLFRRLGYNSRLVFMAHFDWKMVGEALRFGVFEMLGSLAWGIGQSVEVLLTQARLVNYAEVWGNWGVAQNFVFAFNVATTLYNNLMPSISEAFSTARRALCQYYEVMAYKYGGLISAYIAAVLLAVADRFILGATGPEFVRAAKYVIPLIIWGAFQYPSWVGYNIQLAANRPYLKSILVAMEQLVRIGLAWVLLSALQINALILAYFIGIFAKDIVGYLINDKLCFKQRFYAWQSLIAPILAGGAHYLVLRWLTGYIWKGDQITSILIFLIGILLSYPLYAFFYGLFGGWDDATLEEFRRSAELTSFMRPLTRLFHRATALGAKISPLHGRFAVTIRDAALVEARSLTEERVHLV